jgi:co-chaperonin GroES (HSP10)
MTSKLKPLGRSFLFSFVNETVGGRFIEKNRSTIILTNQDVSQQGNSARWGKVIAVGDKVEDFAEGDLVLIESLQWTVEHKFEDKGYWKSDDSKVIAIGLDESVTYAF